MRHSWFAAVVATAIVILASGAHAQIGSGLGRGGLSQGAESLGGLSQGGLSGRGLSQGDLSPGGLVGGRGLEAPVPGSSLALPPPDAMHSPQLPTQQWVPPQREYDPALGREIYVPPHFADETPDGRLINPPMTIPGPGQRPVFVPGGENPAPGLTP